MSRGVRVRRDRLDTHRGVVEPSPGELLEQGEDVLVFEVSVEQGHPQIGNQIGHVEADRLLVQVSQALDVDGLRAAQAQPAAHRPRRLNQSGDLHLVADPADLTEGLLQPGERVQTVLELSGDHPGGHPGRPVDQPFAAEHGQRVADRVAGDPELVDQRALVENAAHLAVANAAAQNVGDGARFVGTGPDLHVSKPNGGSGHLRRTRITSSEDTGQSATPDLRPVRTTWADRPRDGHCTTAAPAPVV